MNWLELAEKKREEFIKVTTELLQIPTVLEKFDPENKEMPFGKDIRQALDMMLAIGKQDGFKTKNVDNYAGHIEYGNGEEVLGILGHLDVVPTGGKWINPPFSAVERDGKIYARGAMDDKGPTVAAYLALKMVKEQGIELNKKVRVILGCDEETGMRGLKHYLSKEKMPDIGFAPDAEFPLIYAEKGIYMYDFTGKAENELLTSMNAGDRYNVVPDVCEVTLTKDLRKEFNKYLDDFNYSGEIHNNKYTIYGKNAHAAMPDLGLNAISLMVEFLKDHTDAFFIHFLNEFLTFDHYGKKLGIDCSDKEMKDLTNNLAFVSYDGQNIRIKMNIRYPRNYDFDAGEAKLTKAGAKYNLEYKCMGNNTPHYVSPDDELVKSLHSAYVKYTGDTENKIFTIGGGTYARVLKKAVAFGALFPGEEELAHQPNEYLIIDQMIKAIAIYAESIVLLAGK